MFEEKIGAEILEGKIGAEKIGAEKIGASLPYGTLEEMRKTFGSELSEPWRMDRKIGCPSYTEIGRKHASGLCEEHDNN